jgi:hypothetical protein
VVIYGSEYWKSVFNLEVLVDKGSISPKDIELFQFADTPEQAFEMLRSGLTRNYLLDEGLVDKAPSREGSEPSEDLMAGSTMEDFLGPELAQTRK